MADISLSDFIALILTELATSFKKAELAELLKLETSNLNFEIPEKILQEIMSLHVSNLELDLPAHLQVKANSVYPTKRLMLSLPSKLTTPGESRLGRIRVTIAPEERSQSEKQRQL